MSRWEFSCKQLFNVFGAPGIPNTYRATLFRDGKKYDHRDFCFRYRAEKQCKRWVDLYGAKPVAEPRQCGKSPIEGSGRIAFEQLSNPNGGGDIA